MKPKKIDRIIVHAGMHKTGSTAIQKALWNLRNDQFHYLRWNGDRNHSIPYLYAFADGGVHAKGAAAKAAAISRGGALRNLLKGELETLGSRNVIITGEAIGAARLGNGVQRLKDFLDPWTRMFDVLMYVRPPRSYAAAEFSQSICGGGTPVLPIRIDYGGIIELDRAFAPHGVSLIPYVRSKLAGKDVVVDFCDRVGIASDLVPSTLANTSPSLELLSILREANAHFKSLPSGHDPWVKEARYTVIKRLSNFGNMKFLISPEAIRDYDAVHDLLAGLSGRIGLDLGATENGSDTTSLASNEQLMEIALESAPMLLDHVRQMAEAGQSRAAQAAAQASGAGRDLASAMGMITKMIEVELTRKDDRDL